MKAESALIRGLQGNRKLCAGKRRDRDSVVERNLLTPPYMPSSRSSAKPGHLRDQ